MNLYGCNPLCDNLIIWQKSLINNIVVGHLIHYLTKKINTSINHIPTHTHSQTHTSFQEGKNPDTIDHSFSGQDKFKLKFNQAKMGMNFIYFLKKLVDQKWLLLDVFLLLASKKCFITGRTIFFIEQTKIK